MRQIKQIFPLLLLIFVLCGTLFFSLPGGPLYGILTNSSSHGVVPPDPDANHPLPPENNGNTDGNENGGGNQDPGNNQTPDGSENQGGNQNSGNNQTENSTPGGNVRPELPSYQYPCDISDYLPAITMQYNRGDILLVNKKTALSANYQPPILSFLNAQEAVPGKSISLEINAAQALRALLLCMRADGITDTYVTSGYRSYEEQVQLHKAYIQKERNTISPEAYAFLGYDYIHEYYTSKGKDRLSLEDATAVALSYSAAPGQSEHQSGLCIDFITMSMSGLTNEQFEATAAFRWLQQYACRFGFILRYPADKTDITGYSYESWHYRFVGREIAMEITQRGITLEEYLAGK